MRTPSFRSLATVASAAVAPLVVALVPLRASASAAPGPTISGSWGGHAALSATTLLSGSSLTHSFTVAGTSTVSSEPLSNPDDITALGRDIFVGFQNGVGPQGQPNGNGNLDSTVVEMTTTGQPVAQWDVQGKTDGVTADPAAHTVIATVNEDANSSLYTITPGPGGGVQHYAYNEPLPHNGGTDAISILNGRILISASAPGTTGTLPAPQPTFPAVYSVTLDAADSVATVTPFFFDEDPAVVANVGTPQTGQAVSLALTDPDSNEIVPPDGPRFAGDFMLTSQGDQEQIFVNSGRDGGWDARALGPRLSVLSLTQSVDDTAWPDAAKGGVLYATDSTNDAVDAVTGDFGYWPIVAATPCGANSAPPTYPTPPAYPANYLASLNPWTGQVSALSVGGDPFVPQGGLLFLPGDASPGQP
jgi:hypothetical protein